MYEENEVSPAEKTLSEVYDLTEEALRYQDDEDHYQVMQLLREMQDVMGRHWRWY
ncbi:hypothetical protein M2480_001324 [Parabacteroides sp. PFB2-12]|uniref:hypothetical protein n=1 Tax=unclassified Parabacteroides TaxID=2649774 RepID=UPI002473BC31|nr:MULTISPECIES: hypothetical protein [unclassified Parabacteroides]MDH6343335.1 hypothetical protein [Parabacteroides sp. PM6-13]MDH6390351.1 hypothetical protein [Parabacteroides sp. PFB2-12]